ncbi:agmatinase [Salinarchaeum sp. Harcht-Bsk1]|uniref:agmatinase n=1 Tax=Salinarchaeum sp. Harcht-Bsk1 TaxID=1333523 RepID=UPI00034248AF|nr:agmatinase [Salinarchaeum sp. Harcht-Bsk1]AGN00634.1 agmatinase [Salinarchaeum sp. Harcht-Bsk1]
MFPGATADRAEAGFAVVGAPLDASTSFQPGTRFGPDRVRQFARPFEDYDHHTDQHFSDLGVHDHGDVRAWPNSAEYLDFLEGELAAFHDEGTVPLTIGGEHAVTVAVVRAVEPDVVVSLDAHLDLRESYDGDELSHACAMRRALETAEEVFVLGARAGSEAEWERAARDDVTVVEPADVADWSPPAAFGSDDRSVYLTVDVDVLDLAFAPGTGTPEPFGLDSATVHDVVRAIAPLAEGFDVVEVNDRDDGQAASVAAKLLRAFVFAHAAMDDP